MKTKRAKVGVIGGGSWATAIAKILSDNKHEVRWWLRKEESMKHIRKFGHNPKYLSSVQFELPPSHISSQMSEVIQPSDWLIFVVPSSYFADTIKKTKASELEGKKILSAIKGLVSGENLPVSQYLHLRYDVPLEMLGNISGPCHAEEVAAEKLSYLTFSSPDIHLAEEAAKLFHNRFMNTFTTTDLTGTEYASSLKNVYALAAGISVGLGYGDNFRAVLISKAMDEMRYFLDNVCPGNRNILASAYLGDTLVTAYSQFSRNRTFGVMIGQGYTINAAKLELGMVAEGYFATKSLKSIASKQKLNMPILHAVYHILYEKISPGIEMRLLSENLN